uniref:V-type proton ATPase subunit C 1-B-like isoform X3 n=1 Tax=Pristiophorus japonicus TaxID=55135 RepID=UPI00398F6197
MQCNCLLIGAVKSLRSKASQDNMSEYWLISAPVDKSNQQIWERMNTVTEKASLSNNFKFPIPELKVGTLDSLVGLSDELGKLDTFVEGIVKKLAQYTADIMEDSKEKAQENLLANGVDLHRYVTHFQWDMAKYPIKQSLQNITEVIAKQISQIDTDLKSRAMTYNSTKGNLQNLERKAVGSLLTRTLADIVNKEDFVIDSEYLTTLLAFVPKTNYINWQKTYESLSDMVVPRSTKMIIEDTEGALFTVTLFKKTVDEFKIRARENKFIVREFSYSEEELHAEKEEMTRLNADKKQQYVFILTVQVRPASTWLSLLLLERRIARTNLGTHRAGGLLSALHASGHSPAVFSPHRREDLIKLAQRGEHPKTRETAGGRR